MSRIFSLPILLVSWSLLASSGLLFGGLVGAAVNDTKAANDTKIHVHIPFSLHDPAGFNHVKADFGFPAVTSGKSLAQYVYFLENPLCQPIRNETIGYPRQHHDGGDGSDGRFTPPFILLVNGGHCTAVTKARNAQQMGASALLIAHDHCLCSDNACIQKFDEKTCEKTEPVLANDGSGSDVSIPTFLLFKTLSVELKNQLKSNKPALVELQWGRKDRDISESKPSYQYWTTAYDPLVTLESYVDLHTVMEALKDYANFEPRYSLIDGKRFDCHGDSGPADNNNSTTNQNATACDHLCIQQGRYCSMHRHDVSGQVIVQETLRRLCIWKHHPHGFMDYVIYHKELCHESKNYGDPQCIHDGFNHAKIKESTIDDCMTDSAGGNKNADGSTDFGQDTTNPLLDEQLTLQSKSGVVTLPSITVNRQPLQYSSARSLFDTICREYWLSGVDNVPKVCDMCSACPNVIGCLRNKNKCSFSMNSQKERHPDTGNKREHHQKKKGKRSAWKSVLGWMFFLGLAGAGAYYVYEKQRQNNNQFGGGGRGLMQEYLQLSGEE